MASADMSEKAEEGGGVLGHSVVGPTLVGELGNLKLITTVRLWGERERGREKEGREGGRERDI